MSVFPTYSTGTVEVTNGGTVITGTGTVWSGVNAKPGDDIVIAGNTVIISDVTSTTTLLIEPWPYATVAAGAAYKIVKRSPLRYVGGQAMLDVINLIASLNADGFLLGTRAVSVTTDTILSTDLDKGISYSNASSIAVTLPQAGSGGFFGDGWKTHIVNIGGGTVTITPSSSTINGSSSLAITSGNGAIIWSDGTNYFAIL